MNTVSLVASMAFSYAGKALAIGDLFTATDRDAQLLKLTKRADDAPSLRKTSRKDLTADAPAGEVVARQKRQYRRRDLVSEP